MVFIPKCRRKTLYAQLRQGFAAGDEALERYFTIPSSTILPLQYPCLGPPGFWGSDRLTHQARHSAPVPASEPVSQLPEDDTVHAAKESGRIVGVLIEVGPPRKFAVQALYPFYCTLLERFSLIV